MASLDQSITVTLPRLHIKVRLPPAYGMRMWMTRALLGLVGKVCPHDIDVEIEGTPDQADR